MNAPPIANEKELLINLRSGDEAAFDQLYRTYSLKIYGNIFKMVKDHDIAQELLQDVFFKAWEKRHIINPDLSFKSYLFKIAKNLVYNHFRNSAVEKKVMDYVASVNSELHNGVEDSIYYKEIRQLIDSSIDQLPPQRKLVYTLCKLEGKTYAEVGELLNISTSTISDHIVKATRFIREQHRLSDGAVILVLASAVIHQL